MSIIAVDVSNDVQRTGAFYEANDYTIPAAFDVGQSVAVGDYGVIATPTNYLLDASGRIVWRHYGFRLGEDALIRERVLEVLAAEE